MWCSCEPNRDLVQYWVNGVLFCTYLSDVCVLTACMQCNPPKEMAQTLQQVAANRRK